MSRAHRHLSCRRRRQCEQGRADRRQSRQKAHTSEHVRRLPPFVYPCRLFHLLPLLTSAAPASAPSRRPAHVAGPHDAAALPVVSVHTCRSDMLVSSTLSHLPLFFPLHPACPLLCGAGRVYAQSNRVYHVGQQWPHGASSAHVPPVVSQSCQSVHPPASPSVRPSVCPSVWLSVGVSVCRSVCPAVCPPVCPSLHPLFRPPARPSVRPSDRLSACLSARPPVYPSTCVCLSVCLPICPSVRLSVRLFVDVSARLCIRLSASLPSPRIFVHLFTPVHVRPSVCPPVCLSICLSVCFIPVRARTCPRIRPSSCRPVYLSVRPHIC